MSSSSRYGRKIFFDCPISPGGMGRVWNLNLKTSLEIYYVEKRTKLSVETLPSQLNLLNHIAFEINQILEHFSWSLEINQILGHWKLTRFLNTDLC